MDLSTPTGRRRFIIERALRCARPGSGSSIEFLQSRSWTDPPITAALRTLPVPYVIVGGLATALYMTRRMTPNTDILVPHDDLESVAEVFRATGWEHRGRLAYGGQAWRTLDGHEVNVLTSDESWAYDAIASPNRSPTGLRVIALPYLVLMKLDASRALDVGDLGRMLGGADQDARDHVLNVVRRYRPTDIDDVESLIALGDLEFVDG
jgi:hypothetical protein